VNTTTLRIAGGVVRPDWEPLRGSADAGFHPSDPRLFFDIEHGGRHGPATHGTETEGAGELIVWARRPSAQAVTFQGRWKPEESRKAFGRLSGRGCPRRQSQRVFAKEGFATRRRFQTRHPGETGSACRSWLTQAVSRIVSRQGKSQLMPRHGAGLRRTKNCVFVPEGRKPLEHRHDPMKAPFTRSRRPAGGRWRSGR